MRSARRAGRAAEWQRTGRVSVLAWVIAEVAGKEVDECPHARWHPSPLGSYRINTGIGNGKIWQHDLQATGTKVGANMPCRVHRYAETGNHRVSQQFALVALDSAVHAHGHFTGLAIRQPPNILSTLAAHQYEAWVPLKIGGSFLHSVLSQILGRGALYVRIGRELAGDKA